MLTTVEELAAIRETMRSLMADHCTEAAVRRTMETAEGYDPALWRKLADTGMTGLIIDPEFGGAGLGAVEMEAVMEEAGAALLASPLLSSAVFAARIIASSGDRAAMSRLLPGIADGSRIVTVAVTGDAGTWSESAVTMQAQTRDGQTLLDGTASFVTHGHVADTLLVVAREKDRIRIYELDARASGVTISPLPTHDRTLPLARLQVVQASVRTLGDAGWDDVEEALRWVQVAQAGEQTGAARRIFDITITYIKERVQFGRPIGGFQAIKHMAADLLLEVETATSAARHAASSLAARADDVSEAVSLAAFSCADSFSHIAATAIQMHGGIAFTWQHPAHLYLRRARAQAQLFGSSAQHRERFLQSLGA